LPLGRRPDAHPLFALVRQPPHDHRLRTQLPSGLVPSLRAKAPRLEVRTLLRTAKCSEPLCQRLALPSTAASPARCQKALPLLHRSYRLMRQTKTLPLPRFVGLCERSLQVVASPCWELALLDVISVVCVKALGPIAGRVFLDPHRARARTRPKKPETRIIFRRASGVIGLPPQCVYGDEKLTGNNATCSKTA